MERQKKTHWIAACLAFSLLLLFSTAFAEPANEFAVQQEIPAATVQPTEQTEIQPVASQPTEQAEAQGAPVKPAAQPEAQPAQLELTLEQAVALALKNNPSGKIAVFDYEAAKGALTASRSARWPTLTYANKPTWTFSGDYYNAANGYDPGYTSASMSNSITFNWIIWSGNKIESQVSQAKLSLDSSKWGVDLARQQLKYNATDGYYKVMAARDAVKLAEESVDRLKQYLRDVNLQFAVGVVAKVDVLRSEVSLAQAQENLITAQNTYDLAMASLNNILGLPLTTFLKVAGDMSYADYTESLAKCTDVALRQRPEIAQSTDAAKSAQEGITIAKAGYLPTVAATYVGGEYNKTWPGFNGSINGYNTYNWTAYITTSWTILDSGLTAGSVKKAVETYRKAQEQLKQTLDTVRLDVQSTYLSLKASEQSIVTSKASVGLAEEDYKIKVVRYKAGVGTNLDVLDAQEALTKAKNNYLQAMYNNNDYRAKLDKVMGVPVK